MAHATTVLGPVPADELGFTLPHEHLLFDLFKGFQPHREFLVNDRDLVCTELEAFVSAGGSTLVEVTTPDFGRDPAGLVDIAQRTGLNIVMATGRYREPFYEPEIRRRSTTDIASEFINDLERGVQGVRAGIIGEIGTHEPYISPAEERIHRAAAHAQVETGAAITTHANASDVGLLQLDLLEEAGADLRRVVIGHCDTHPFLDYHRAIVERGAYVEFDTIRGVFEYETRRQVEFVRQLASEGYIEQVLLSQDMASNRLYTSYGGPGFGFLISEFVERLRKAGLSDEQVHMLTVENPGRVLALE